MLCSPFLRGALKLEEVLENENKKVGGLVRWVVTVAGETPVAVGPLA